MSPDFKDWVKNRDYLRSQLYVEFLFTNPTKRKIREIRAKIGRKELDRNKIEVPLAAA